MIKDKNIESDTSDQRKNWKYRYSDVILLLK